MGALAVNIEASQSPPAVKASPLDAIRSSQEKGGKQ